MPQQQRHFFTLHELLIMTVLAALGGVFGVVVSPIANALSAMTGLGLGQAFAGIHVLPIVLAAALIRKPGAATTMSLLKGSVEFLAGSRHGLFVLAICGLAGLTVDIVWILLGRRDHVLVYALVGGFASTTNLLVAMIKMSIDRGNPFLTSFLATLGVGAFASGVVLAGILARYLLRALRHAGVVPPRSP